MLRQRENSESLKAGVLSVLVHVLLLGALLISFNWKTTHPVSIAEVELWDSLPAESVHKPLPPPMPVVEPKPVVKEVPKPAPVVEKPVLKLDPKPDVDIAIEKKPIEKPIKEKPVKKDEPKEVKKPDALAELQKELMKDNPQKPRKQSSDDALKKLQQESLNEDKTAGEQSKLAAKAAANAGIVDEFKAKIQNKIYGHVNKTLCGDGKPVLKFEISLLPTGELSTNPKLMKSSGNPACDDAVERAIMASEPLPLPKDATLFSQEFRSLKLTFRPND